MTSTPKSVLYLTYDGLTDPLGQSQIIPYLKGLSKDFRISIISFEKVESKHKIDSIALELKSSGIVWHPLRYTKKPPVFSTLWDVCRLRRMVFQLHKNQPFSLIHCRSYITSLIGLSLKRKKGVPFLFDMRDFWPDERVDGGLWNLKNPIFKSIYKFFKKKEQDFHHSADAIITLTNKAKTIIGLPGKTHVIPTCVDIDFFSKPQLNSRSLYGIGEQTFVLSYVGSTGTWYRTSEVWELFRLLKKEEADSKLLIISKSYHNLIKAELSSHNIDMQDVIMVSANRNEMPGLISISDWSAFFYEPKPSKAGTSPTRLAELVCQNIPIISNSGIGDLDSYFKRYRIGYLIQDLNDSEQLIKAKDFVLDHRTFKSESKLVYELFDLERGVKNYLKVYNYLMNSLE